MQWTPRDRKTSEPGADGEIAWSWRPDAGVNPRVKSPGGRWLKSPVHRGEREISRTTIAQGMPECFGVPVVTCLRAFLCCTQGCGCDRAPGIPCALAVSRDIAFVELGHFVDRKSVV